MAKVKHTKTALKAQRDELKQFQRYLPTLQLKKQQLQLETRKIRSRMEELQTTLKSRLSEADSWIGMFAEQASFDDYLKVISIRTRSGNIAGVDIPFFEEVEFDRTTPDIFQTRAWIDDGLQLIEDTIRLESELSVLNIQLERLEDELRTTSQRVNLFEKVKIPQAKENIRTIRIFLGDQQTAAVARAKIAKGKTREREAAA